MQLEPKELELTDGSGRTRTFFISKFPAIAGREIVTSYPVANMPKVGEYKRSEEVMLKLMTYVSVAPGDGGPPIALTTRALVDNHVGDWETLARLEWAMLEYNCGFFTKGLSSDFLSDISPKVVSWITQTLMPSLDQSLQAGKQRSSSSKPS